MPGCGARSGWFGPELRCSAAASTSCGTSNVKLRSARSGLRVDFHRILYAVNADADRAAYAAFERTWAKRCPGVVKSLGEGGEELCAFFRFLIDMCINNRHLGHKKAGNSEPARSSRFTRR